MDYRNLAEEELKRRLAGQSFPAEPMPTASARLILPALRARGPCGVLRADGPCGRQAGKGKITPAARCAELRAILTLRPYRKPFG